MELGLLDVATLQKLENKCEFCVFVRESSVWTSYKM